MRNRRRRGAEIIEFALILPLFLVIVGGAIDFGWAYYHRSILDTATNVGCRAGALVDPGEDEANMDLVLEAASDAVHGSLAAGGLACGTGDKCTVEVAVTHMVPGRSLTCTATRHVEPLWGVHDGYDLESTMMVRLEWQR